jgi:hypothetical protein
MRHSRNPFVASSNLLSAPSILPLLVWLYVVASSFCIMAARSSASLRLNLLQPRAPVLLLCCFSAGSAVLFPAPPISYQHILFSSVLSEVVCCGMLQFMNSYLFKYTDPHPPFLLLTQDSAQDKHLSGCPLSYPATISWLRGVPLLFVSPYNHNDGFPLHRVPLLTCMTLPASDLMSAPSILPPLQFCSNSQCFHKITLIRHKM